MASLLEELGIDPEFFNWIDLGLCRKIDTEYFFDKYESSPEIARAVDAMCDSCPVQQECGMAGKNGVNGKTGEYGVWGGIYWNGSGKPDPNKNSHKEPWKLAELLSRFNETE